MKPNDKDTSWKVKVRRFKSVSTGTTADHEMMIPQKNLCTQWPKVQKPLGRPVDTDMAVKFIRNFLDDHHDLANQTHNHFVDAQDKDTKVFFGKILNYLNKIVMLNYAMSLDKNMALKVLSQPGCEGLRFYLCEKKKDQDVLDQIKSESQGVNTDEMETSLVVVGFDICGNDLNYVYNQNTTYQTSNIDAIVPASEAKKAIKHIEMQSLNVEYVTPPPPPPPPPGGGIVSQLRNVDDEFVLLKFALNE